MSLGNTGNAGGGAECARARGIMIDDALGQATAPLVELARAHIERCPFCRGEVEALRATVAMLRRPAATTTSRQFRPRLTAALDAVDRERVAPIRVLRPSWSGRRVAAAAALVTVGVGLGWYIVHQMRDCGDDGEGTFPTRIRTNSNVTRSTDPSIEPRIHPRPDGQPVDTSDPDWQRFLLDELDKEARRRELAHLPPDAPRPQKPPIATPDPALPDFPDRPTQGPTPRVVKAAPTPIDRALDWLVRNQKADGSWTPGRGEPGLDTAVTALALLAFVSHDHLGGSATPADFAADRAQAWLFTQQDRDGRFRGGSDDAAAAYSHAAACLALVEHHVRSLAAKRLDPSVAKGDHERLERALSRLEGSLEILNSSGDQSRCAGNNAAWAALALTTAGHCGVDFHLNPRTEALVAQTLNRLKADQPELMAAASQTILAMADRDAKPLAREDVAWARVVDRVLSQPEKVEPSLRFLIASALHGATLPRSARVPDWTEFEGSLAQRLISTQSENGFFDSGMTWDCFGGGVVGDTSLAVLTLSVRERHDAWAAARKRLEASPPPPARTPRGK